MTYARSFTRRVLARPASGVLRGAVVFVLLCVGAAEGSPRIDVETALLVVPRTRPNARFTLRGRLSGLDVATLPTSGSFAFSLESFSQSTPFSAFAKLGEGSWVFHGRGRGVRVVTLTRSLAAKSEVWEFKVAGHRADLGEVTLPIALDIGFGEAHAHVLLAMKVSQQANRSLLRIRRVDGLAVRCGDAQLDGGEDCDPGDDVSGDCCTSGCRFAGAEVACRPAANACDGPETCSGTSMDCPPDAAVPDGTSCTDGQFCNGAEVCRAGTCNPGVAPCPADQCDETVDRCGNCGNSTVDAGEQCDPPGGGGCPAGSVCTSACQCVATQACGDGRLDQGEECDPGADVAGDCCTSACRFTAAGVVCRAATQACDAAEACSGTAATCPGDGAAPDGTPCADGLFCNGAEVCQGGACQPGTPACPAACDENADRCGTCGDSTVDAGEECDPPGNTDQCSDGGTCTATCSCAVVTPTIEITAPNNLTLFKSVGVHVEGTATRAVSIDCAGVPAMLDGSAFQADVTLREGRNSVSCVARTAGGVAAVDTVQLVVDQTPPRVIIQSPPSGFVTTTAEIEVTGSIADVASTAVEAQDPLVMVNGIQALVTNGTFVVSSFLLQPGVNTITVTSADAAGNVGTASIDVTLATGAGQRLEALSGNGQAGPAGEMLTDPLVVRLTDQLGSPVAGRTVTFTVTQGEGTLQAFPNEGRTVPVTTDDSGRASARFTLGGRAGFGNQQAQATVVGVPGAVAFCASARNLAPQRIVAVAGSDQTGAVGTRLPAPLTILVTDTRGNPVPDVPVTFQVTAGGGSIAGGATFAVTTDTGGHASAVLTLGPQEGIGNNTVTASFEGLTESPAVFVESALVPGPESATTVSGLVLDNQDDPVPGATALIKGTSNRTVTDDHGRFTLRNVPVGTVTLQVDGTTTSRAGTWPVLDFEMVTVCGRDNTVGMPIRLLPIDVFGGEIAGGDQDVAIQMAEVPGAELTVFARSVTFPDGSRIGRVSFTQVHADKVPMIAPMGSSFALAFTVQPRGTRFDPPARLALPNTGLPPGSFADMFSFDHDIGEFVSIGPATVTEDGTQLISSPGFGISKAGWGGAVPPPPPPTCVSNPPPCMECRGGRFVPAREGERCEDADAISKRGDVGIGVDSSCFGSADLGDAFQRQMDSALGFSQRRRGRSSTS